jgi:hypothetical protein
MENFNFDIISLIIGLVIGAVLYMIKGFFSIRKYKKELAEYKGHLATQMKITQEGTKNIPLESEKLKENEVGLKTVIKRVFGPSITHKKDDDEATITE